MLKWMNPLESCVAIFCEKFVTLFIKQIQAVLVPRLCLTAFKVKEAHWEVRKQMSRHSIFVRTMVSIILFLGCVRPAFRRCFNLFWRSYRASYDDSQQRELSNTRKIKQNANLRPNFVIFFCVLFTELDSLILDGCGSSVYAMVIFLMTAKNMHWLNLMK